MDIQSWAFVGGFCGAAVGLPAGFVAIEMVKLIVSKIAERRDPNADTMEWAISQPGVTVVHEQQVANNWIKTYDTQDIEADSEGGDVVRLELPYRYVTSAVGGAGTPPPLMTDSLADATQNQMHLVNKIRKVLGIIPG